MTLHQDLHAHVNRSRAQADGDVRIEELESAVERITLALGDIPFTGELPEPDGEPDALLDEARTCIRNDDIVGARIRILQVIAMGGGSGPVPDKDKPVAKMGKSELVAYAKARDYNISAAQGSKPAMKSIIQDLDAEAASATV